MKVLSGQGCIYKLWNKELTPCSQGLWQLMSSGDGHRGSPVREAAARGISVQEMLNFGTWWNTLNPSVPPPPSSKILCFFLWLVLHWKQRYVCKSSFHNQQGKAVQSRELFPAPTGTNSSLPQWGTFLTNFLPSTFWATILHTGLLVFSRKRPVLEDKAEQRNPSGKSATIMGQGSHCRNPWHRRAQQTPLRGTRMNLYLCTKNMMK